MSLLDTTVVSVVAVGSKNSWVMLWNKGDLDCSGQSDVSSGLPVTNALEIVMQKRYTCHV